MLSTEHDDYRWIAVIVDRPDAAAEVPANDGAGEATVSTNQTGSSASTAVLR